VFRFLSLFLIFIFVFTCHPSQFSYATTLKKQPTQKWQTFKATFYNAHCKGCSGRTKSGRNLAKGISISVDPKVIPLGTWILIKYSNGIIEKRRADDTGGRIKGKKIDIYIPKSKKELMQLGKQTIQIQIL